jgi:hypothetical protein
MKKISLIGLISLAVVASTSIACSQTSPGLVYGQVPTAAQWNAYFAAKQDWPVPVFSLTTNGLVPFPGTSSGNCLKDDATWGTCGSGGGGTPANPTATIGATAVNGVATTYMRSDAAPALPATLPALNGSLLTSLTAANLSGAVPVNKGGTNCTVAAIACVTAISGATGAPSSSTFLRGDNTWATPAGSGNVTGPGSSVSGNVTSFSGTSGTLIQDTGIASSALATLTGSQTLTNKTISGASNTLSAIGNGSLTNSAMTLCGVSTSLGGSLTASACLDSLSSTRGTVLYRGASGWSALAPATAGNVLSTNGAGADPSWISVGGTGTVTTLTAGNGVLFSSGATCTTTCTISLTQALNAQTGASYALLSGDGGKLVTRTNAGAITDTIAQATGSFGAGYGVNYGVMASSAGSATLTPTTSNVSGLAALTLSPGQWASIFSDGTNYQASVSLPLLANNRFFGNNSGGTSYGNAMTGTQATALLDTFTSSLKGLAPSSGGGTTNFLRADGTWAAPPGGGSGCSVSSTQYRVLVVDAAGTGCNATANGTLNNGALTLGVAGANQGSIAISGATSGTITIAAQAAAGTFNWNLPTTAGTAGDCLKSGGGGASAMTWGACGGGGGGSTYTATFTGNVSGTPSAVGLGLDLAAFTITDNATAGSGTLALAAAHSIEAPTLAATNTSVTTTHATTLYIAGVPVTGTNETITAKTAMTIAAGGIAHLDSTTDMTFYQASSPGQTNTTYGFIGWDNTNFFTIKTARTGSGTQRNIRIDSANGTQFYINGSSVLNINNSATVLDGNSGTGFGLTNSNPSGTVPVFLVNKTSTNTGWGAQAAGNISGIAGGTEKIRIDSNGMSIQSGVLTLKGFTVSTLPASPATGSLAYVTDANAACSYNTAPTGGGSTVCKVWYNGTAWVQG